jgi:hypothetical protein
MISIAKEYHGKTERSGQVDINCPAYVHVNFNHGKLQINWYCRDNIFKEETVIKITSQWLFEIQDLIDELVECESFDYLKVSESSSLAD